MCDRCGHSINDHVIDDLGPCCLCSCDWFTRPAPPPDPDPVCVSCLFVGQKPPMKVDRKIAGRWYCFAHGMDLYCD